MTQQKHKDPLSGRRTFRVESSDINERGTMFPCMILNQIAATNDELILKHFGFLDHDAITTLSYHVHITGQAFLDDDILLEWDVMSAGKEQLELLVFANRGIGNSYQPVAEGSFIFKLVKTENVADHLNTSLHLFTAYNQS